MASTSYLKKKFSSFLITVLSIIFVVITFNDSFCQESEINEKNVVEKNLNKLDKVDTDKVLKNKNLQINNVRSIMFNDDEMVKIEEAIEARKNNKPLEYRQLKSGVETTVEKESRPYIYLSLLIYKSANNWLVSLNDKKISPLNNNPNEELYIKSISKNKVTIIWSLSLSKWRILTNKTQNDDPKTNSQNQVQTEFTLTFNQSFLLDNQKIIEGNFSNILKQLKLETKTEPQIPNK